MSKAKDKARLAEVKTALAEKCERLIKTTSSAPRRATLMYQAARFRRQAADLKQS